MKLNKNNHDITQIFLVYMALVGDAEKTAAALDLDVEFVGELATREGWAAKVQRISIMSKSGVPGDWERAQNRALNFVQCHQLRRTIDRVITHLSTLEVAEIIDTVDQGGNHKLSTRLMTDLANAMDRIHALTYAALGDSPKERSDRGDSANGDALSSAGLHSALIAALNTSKLSGQPSEKLVQDAVAKVTELTQEPVSPA